MWESEWVSVCVGGRVSEVNPSQSFFFFFIFSSSSFCRWWITLLAFSTFLPRWDPVSCGRGGIVTLHLSHESRRVVLSDGWDPSSLCACDTGVYQWFDYDTGVHQWFLYDTGVYQWFLYIWYWCNPLFCTCDLDPSQTFRRVTFRCIPVISVNLLLQYSIISVYDKQPYPGYFIPVAKLFPNSCGTESEYPSG